MIILPPDRDVAVELWADHHFEDVSKEELIRFALAYHFSTANHNEVLRKSGESYYRHDCRCAARMLDAGFPLELAIVMLLHEAIEDDGWTKEMIVSHFGSSVAKTVEAVSKDPKDVFENRQARLADHIERMERAVLRGNWKVAVVKVVDRLDNSTDTAGLDEEDQQRLFKENETDFLRLFRRVKDFIPKKYRSVYSVWVREIEFACANYWRRQALRQHQALQA